MADEYEFMDTQDISENGPNTSEDSVNAEEDNEPMMPAALRGMLVP